MPRPPARVRHLPPKSPTPPPNNRRPKPWCTQYSQDLKEHLAAEKQIAAARADEVAMATIRDDPPDLGGAPCHLLATPVKHARFTRCVCCSCLSFTNSSELCYLILPCNPLLLCICFICRVLWCSLITVWLISCRLQLTVWFNSANVMFNSLGYNFVLSSM